MANKLILSLNFTRNRLVFVTKLLCPTTLCPFVYGHYYYFFFIKNKKKGSGDLSWRLLFGCDYSDILSTGFRIVGVENSNEL